MTFAGTGRTQVRHRQLLQVQTGVVSVTVFSLDVDWNGPDDQTVGKKAENSSPLACGDWSHESHEIGVSLSF